MFHRPSDEGRSNLDSAWGIGPNEIHCWTFEPLRFPEQLLASVLSRDEQARAGRYHFDRDRKEFVVCRGLLRYLLAGYGGGTPGGLRFNYTTRGKPLLASVGRPMIKFNVAHSGGTGLIGITCGRSIGVDVEKIRPIQNIAGMVRSCFAPEEQAEFRALPDRLQQMAFFTGWTRKEAFIKATGDGLNRPLHSFAVTISPDSPPRLLRADEMAMFGEKWQIVDLGRKPGFSAALATADPDAIVRTRPLLPDFLDPSFLHRRHRANE